MSCRSFRRCRWLLLPALLLPGLRAAEPPAASPTFVLLRSNVVASTRPAEVRAVHEPGADWQHTTGATAHPTLTNAFVMVGQTNGRLWLLEPDAAGGARRTVFAELGGGAAFSPWEGFLSVAFHPQFATNRRWFVKHDDVRDGVRSTVVVERRATPDGRADAGGPGREIIRIPTASENHHGGTVLFGPDGMLYLGMGDGGPQEDPNGHAQDGAKLLGKILRLDVDRPDRGRAFGIPRDNPFVAQPAAGIRPEVWALGFREPWRMSFDRATGELWVGDVGQLGWEEVCLVRAGENHGWNVYEGLAPFSEKSRRPGRVFTPPVLVYGRDVGCSITGGFVYRGTRAPAFVGAYLFGDFVMREIFALRRRPGAASEVRRVAVAAQPLVSFCEGRDGELYAVGHNGSLHHLDLATAEFP